MLLHSSSLGTLLRQGWGTMASAASDPWASQQQEAAPWPPGQGASASQIRCQDWSATLLGPTKGWPVWLKTSVSALLDSPLPSVLLLGSELVKIHNDAYVPLLGAGRTSAIGQRWDACRPGAWFFSEGVLRRVLQSGRSENLVDWAYQPEGPGAPTTQYFDIAYVPARDEAGAVHGVSVVAVETTKRVALERANAALAQRAQIDAEQFRQILKDEFLATLAHELRNPLAPIANVANLLGRLPDADGRLKGLGDTLLRQTAHMSRLIDDLLDTSRMGRGQMKMLSKTLDLRTVLEAAVEQVSPAMKRCGHALEVRLAESPLVVEGDSARLVQVFANLLNNAAKFTPPGGKVALDASLCEAGLQIEVRDNGAGIDADFLPLMFEPFQQGKRAAARDDNGLGLGLALVRSLVELHGGSVAAASAGPGLGSAFTVRLPLHIA